MKNISHLLGAILFVFTASKITATKAAFKGWSVTQIDGEEILVSCSAVSEPVAIRYPWSGNPKAVVCSLEGLTASPFRTYHF
ncbi:hypothetical protein BH10BAC3_BH10BAC3_37140 [soil metagenome]